jgi:two-component system NtrC family sensor kinase
MTEGQGPTLALDGEKLGGEREARVASGEIERIIPWRDRIRTKLLFAVVIVTVGSVAMFAFAERGMQDQLFESQASGAALFSETIQKAILRSMLEDRRDDAAETMRDIGRQDGVEAVRLMTKDGRVSFSTAAAEIGTVFPTSAAACRPCHGNGRPQVGASLMSRARVFEAPAGRVLGFVTPIRNEPGCWSAACHAHPQSQGVLGVLDVSLSLSSVDARVGAFRRTTIALTAIGLVLASVIFMAFARYHVIRPVQALVDGTRQVALDRLDTEIRVGTRGELGLLAASFNDMTRSLKRMDLELRSLMSDLERQVEERTADLKKAQAALVQTEKLSSLGRLSASIAHEINNPLAGILTFAKLVIRDLEAGPPDEPARKEMVRNLALVERETQRCSAIVRNLLDFARDRPLALKEVSVNTVTGEVLQLVSNQAAIQGLVLEKRLEPVPPIMGDPGQLRQAVLNVVLNACEAMGEGGGTVSVTTRASAEGGAEIVVSDTGPGISPEHLPDIYEPFFTTKEKGTGLGLSVVYGIMQRHRGRVEAQSEPGRGATFTLSLPPLSTPASPLPNPPPSGGREGRGETAEPP